LHVARIRTHLCANVEEVCAAIGMAAGFLPDEALPAPALDVLVLRAHAHLSKN
jgi:hypothetical protein